MIRHCKFVLCLTFKFMLKFLNTKASCLYFDEDQQICKLPMIQG